MPWQKVNIDDVVDVRLENDRTIGRVLENLDKVQCLYTQMRASAFMFETNILQLVERLDTEGGQSVGVSANCFCFPYQSQVDHYNTLLCDFLNQINLFLSTPCTNQDGIGAPLIGTWNAHDHCGGKTTTYYLRYKQPGYMWTNNNPICIVDNIRINGDCCTCPSATTKITISMGCSPIVATFFNVAIHINCPPDFILNSAGDNPTFNAFYTYLCKYVPYEIHNFLAHLSKNILAVDNCIKQINNIVDVFDLL